MLKASDRWYRSHGNLHHKDIDAGGQRALTLPHDACPLRERLAAERERVIAAAKARYDHEVSAVAHHAKQYDA